MDKFFNGVKLNEKNGRFSLEVLRLDYDDCEIHSSAVLKDKDLRMLFDEDFLKDVAKSGTVDSSEDYLVYDKDVKVLEAKLLGKEFRTEPLFDEDLEKTNLLLKAFPLGRMVVGEGDMVQMDFRLEPVICFSLAEMEEEQFAHKAALFEDSIRQVADSSKFSFALERYSKSLLQERKAANEYAGYKNSGKLSLAAVKSRISGHDGQSEALFADFKGRLKKRKELGQAVTGHMSELKRNYRLLRMVGKSLVPAFRPEDFLLDNEMQRILRFEGARKFLMGKDAAKPYTGIASGVSDRLVACLGVFSGNAEKQLLESVKEIKKEFDELIRPALLYYVVLEQQRRITNALKFVKLELSSSLAPEKYFQAYYGKMLVSYKSGLPFRFSEDMPVNSMLKAGYTKQAIKDALAVVSPDSVARSEEQIASFVEARAAKIAAGTERSGRPVTMKDFKEKQTERRPGRGGFSVGE